MTLPAGDEGLAAAEYMALALPPKHEFHEMTVRFLAPEMQTRRALSRPVCESRHVDVHFPCRLGPWIPPRSSQEAPGGLRSGGATGRDGGSDLLSTRRPYNFMVWAGGE